MDKAVPKRGNELRLKQASDDWDKTMLPIPPEAKHGPWEGVKK